jgi:hypothetical protein
MGQDYIPRPSGALTHPLLAYGNGVANAKGERPRGAGRGATLGGSANSGAVVVQAVFANRAECIGGWEWSA